MKTKILLPCVLAAFLTTAFLVMGVTLTKDATEKVIVPKAYRITVEDSDGGTDEMVFGYADIYAKNNPNVVAVQLAIFIHEGVLYRTTGWGAVFDQTNCRLETITDPPEKGGQTREVTMCDQGKIIGENGGGSIVNPDGTEINDVFTYSLTYDADGGIGDLVFTFKQGGRVLKLRSIEKVAAEPVEWRPE